MTDAFAGREPERAALEAAAARARAGEGSIVLLAGEAGVGKSMLARTALAGCDLELYEGFGVQDGASAYGPMSHGQTVPWWYAWSRPAGSPRCRPR